MAVVYVNDSVTAPCPNINILRQRLNVSTYATPCESVESYQVEQYWGKPDSVNILSPNKEEWEYKDSDYRWSGIWLMLVWVPVPILVPTGKEKISLVMENGYVASATKHGSKEMGGGFYYWPGHDEIIGFKTSSPHFENYPGDAITTNNSLFIKTTPENTFIKMKRTEDQFIQGPGKLFIQGMNVGSGSNTYTISAPGYLTREIEVTLLPNETKTISVSLQREMAPPLTKYVD